MSTEIHYALRVADGEIRLVSEENGPDACDCGTHSHTLVGPDDYRWASASQFRLADPAAVQAFMLHGPSEWYNSSPEQPSWGAFSEEDFTFEKVTVTREAAAFTFRRPVRLADSIKNCTMRKVIGPERNRIGLSEDATAVLVWRYEPNPDYGSLSGRFEMEPDAVEALLRDELVVFSTGDENIWHLVAVEQRDADCYHIFFDKAALRGDQ